MLGRGRGSGQEENRRYGYHRVIPSKHMTSKGRWVLVDFWSRRHITNIQRHSDVKMKRLINVGF